MAMAYTVAFTSAVAVAAFHALRLLSEQRIAASIKMCQSVDEPEPERAADEAASGGGGKAQKNGQTRQKQEYHRRKKAIKKAKRNKDAARSKETSESSEEQTPCETLPVFGAGNKYPFKETPLCSDYLDHWIGGPKGNFDEGSRQNFFSEKLPNNSTFYPTVSPEQRYVATLAQSLFNTTVVVTQQQMNCPLFPEVINAVVELALAMKRKGD
jgi:hypothetical protein